MGIVRRLETVSVSLEGSPWQSRSEKRSHERTRARIKQASGPVPSWDSTACAFVGDCPARHADGHRSRRLARGLERRLELVFNAMNETINEPTHLTLIRYAGRELTQKINDVVVEELKTNEYLSDEERVNLNAIVEDCNVWLE